MKGVQCYELFGEIFLYIRATSRDPWFEFLNCWMKIMNIGNIIYVSVMTIFQHAIAVICLCGLCGLLRSMRQKFVN